MISIFKALSDLNRLKLMAALTKHAELCACQLSGLLQVSGATTSRHLEILLAAGLINKRKDGRWVYYRLNADNEEFEAVMDWIKDEFSKSRDIENCLDTLEELTKCKPEIFCNNKNKANNNLQPEG